MDTTWTIISAIKNLIDAGMRWEVIKLAVGTMEGCGAIEISNGTGVTGVNDYIHVEDTFIYSDGYIWQDDFHGDFHGRC